MATLADVADVEKRLGRKITTSSEIEQVGALLVDASAKVRSYTRQTFDLVEDDEVILRPVGTMLRLPQRPVTAVSAVAAIGWDGTTDTELALNGYGWDGADLVDIGGVGSYDLTFPEWWNDTGASSYRVTYSHGYAETPEDVVAVVCAMVIRVVNSPSPVEGMVTERIGQYSYGLQQGTGAAGAAVRLTDADKEDLKDYRRSSGTIAVHVR